VKGTKYKLKYRKFHVNIGKSTFHCEGGQMLEQVVQRCCGVSMLGDIQKPMEHGPEQPAPAEPPWIKGVERFQKCLPTSALTVVLSIVKHLALSI